jgi:hypothetical protein
VVTGVGQHKSAMEQKEQEKQPPVSTTVVKEVEEWWDIIWEDVGCTEVTMPTL